jgi:hypothetical protein
VASGEDDRRRMACKTRLFSRSDLREVLMVQDEDEWLLDQIEASYDAQYGRAVNFNQND